MYHFKKNNQNIEIMKKKKGIITKEDLKEARLEAERLAKTTSRNEIFIKINEKHTIGVPANLSKEQIAERVERFKNRIGLNKVRVA